MKKVLALCLFLVTMPTYAITWSSVDSLFKDKIKPDAAYTVDTSGYNLRVYEFTTQTDPIQKCIVISNDEYFQANCTIKGEK